MAQRKHDSRPRRTRKRAAAAPRGTPAPPPPPYGKHPWFDPADARGGQQGTWRDGCTPGAPAGEGFWYDSAAAQLRVDFIQEALKLPRSKVPDQPFILQDWQAPIVRAIFGWKRPDGTRKFRKVFIFVASASGKSPLLAAIALCLLFIDGEPRAEIYNVAKDREQAGIVFDDSKAMVMDTEWLARRVDIFIRSIVVKRDLSSYKVLSGEPGGKHGKRTHGLIVDELHEINRREMMAALEGTMGKRTQPLQVEASTAGFDRNSICYERYDYAKKVLAGTVQDDYFLPVIYELDPKDDVADERNWYKANPGLGVTVSMDFLRQGFKLAQEVPSELNNWLRLHGNLWTDAETAWLSVEKWDACLAAPHPDASGPLQFFAALRGRHCFGALDLGATDDLSALAMVFPPAPEIQNAALPGRYPAVMRYWMPKDNVEQRSRHSRLPYDKWSRNCHCPRGGDPLACRALIHLTPGNVTDYEFIRRDINALSHAVIFNELAMDPHLAQHLLSLLAGDGLNCFKHMQGFLSMGFAVKSYERLVLGGLLAHAKDDVTRWQFGNIVAQLDPAGNAKFTKKKAREKIDGHVALAMAAGRAMLQAPGNVVKGAVLL